MELKLTCSTPSSMTDTNKLLLHILNELVEINKSMRDRTQDDEHLSNTNSQAETQKVATEQIEGNAVKEGSKCKYCGEFIVGNRGNMLAHMKKCPERK